MHDDDSVRFALEHDPHDPTHAGVRVRLPVLLHTLHRPHADHAVNARGTPAMSPGGTASEGSNARLATLQLAVARFSIPRVTMVPAMSSRKN